MGNYKTVESTGNYKIVTEGIWTINSAIMYKIILIVMNYHNYHDNYFYIILSNYLMDYLSYDNFHVNHLSP